MKPLLSGHPRDKGVHLIEVSPLYTGTLKRLCVMGHGKVSAANINLVVSVLGRLFLEKICMTFWWGK